MASLANRFLMGSKHHRATASKQNTPMLPATSQAPPPCKCLLLLSSQASHHDAAMITATAAMRAVARNHPGSEDIVRDEDTSALLV
jgi:hypothetical protein